MKNRKKTIQEVVCVVVLLAAMIGLFQWYTTQNSIRMEERNKNYAADSARQTTTRINEKMNNALELIHTYAYFVSEGLKQPVVNEQMLQEIEHNALFDAVLFTDAAGVNHTSDGRTSDASDRDYYKNGMRGESGIAVILDSYFFNETMVSFYVPLRYKGEIIGVLRGSYLAEEYLKDMLSTTYFGEAADVYLCMPNGRAIASSDGNIYEEDLIDTLVKNKVIDKDTAAKAKDIFAHGGEGAFICAAGSKTDNICVMHLPDNDFVLVQTFPKNVTQQMIRDENIVGIQLEMMLIGLFVIYIIILLVRARREKKMLEDENREMGYIINGVTTLFSRFAMVDFSTGTYQYLAGTTPQDGTFAVKGAYQELVRHLCSELIEDRAREELMEHLDQESLIQALNDHNDARFECHVVQGGKPEWEHVNIICLERNEGRAEKLLLIRQNITEVKEKELHIQAKMAVANRKERQYQIAITSNAICTFEFNLTQDRIEKDIRRDLGGERVSLLQRVELAAPCRVSEWFRRWEQFVLSDSLEDYRTVVNTAHLIGHYDQGESEVSVEYWCRDCRDQEICIRQSFLMTRDDETRDILVMVVMKEITESVRKQKEQTQALQDALMQAQHANRAKTTFLSNMSHDIRTPMNAVIGFTTLLAKDAENPEKVREYTKKIMASGQHLLSLINDILDVSKIESGKVVLTIEEFTLNNLISSVDAIIRPMASARGQKFFVEVTGIRHEYLMGDETRINQILINLLSNAVKYTPEGGNIWFRIIGMKQHSSQYEHIRIEVQDDGYGMTPEYLKVIFDAFTRAENSTTNKVQGTGLGMAITKNIVKLMGGTIDVSSEVNKGTLFRVELELRIPEEQAIKRLWEENGISRILAVDNNQVICENICMLMKDTGVITDIVPNIKEAIQILSNTEYQILLIDWDIVEKEGIQSVKEIRKILPETILILFLADCNAEGIEEALLIKNTKVLTKPFFVSAFQEKLLESRAEQNTDSSKENIDIDNLEGLYFLVAEDNDINAEILREILSMEGANCEIVENGQLAVERFEVAKEKEFDAILMDVQMPVMNGYDATKKIRALNRKDAGEIPIIAMTANAFAEDEKEALDAGMNVHLAKPINIEMLKKVIHQYVNRDK